MQNPSAANYFPPGPRRSRLGYFAGVYRAQLKLAVAVMTQYRFAVLIWGVWGFVGPLISLAVWSAAVQARGGSIANAGASYSRADFAAYFLTYMVFSHFTMSWDMFEFGWRVREGRLSPALLKPVNPVHQDAAYNLGFKLITASMLFPAWVLLFLLLRPTPPETWTGLLLAIPAVVLAGVTRYILQYALACLAFWTQRVEAINQLYFSLDSFLGGRIAPLSLLPGWLAAIAYYTPFRSIGAFPVEVALGSVPPAEILPGFLLQIGWLIGAALLFRLAWNAGIKQYAAVGA